MPKKSELSQDQRVEAVMAMLRREEPVPLLARRYGVSEQSLYRWRDEFINAGKQGLGGKSSAAESAREQDRLKREIESRDQVIGELTIANRILKKLSGPSL
jgi:transposase-like protein